MPKVGWQAVWGAAKTLDTDLSGVSWNGFAVAGDEKSIAEVRRLMHVNDRAIALQNEVLNTREERQKCADLLHDEQMEHNLLKELLSRPEIDDFWEGIVTEAAHQRQRWGDAHDRDKSAENWFWLVGYLSGKALRASIEGDKAKAKHHTISTAAALFQWHQAICADETGAGRGLDEDIDPEVGRLGVEPSR